MTATVEKIAELKARYQQLGLKDGSRAFNTEWLQAIELGFLLDVAEAMSHAALARQESRGSHQRPEDFPARNDALFLRHSLARQQQGGANEVSWQDVVITRSAPGERHYGGKATGEAGR